MEREQRFNRAFYAAWHDVSVAVVSERPQNEILCLILKQLEDFIGARNAYIALVNPATESFIPLVATGIFPEMIHTHTLVKKGEGVAGRAWQDGKSVLVNAKDRAEYASPLFSNGFSAAIAIPVFQNEVVTAILGVAYVEIVRDFDDLDIRHLESFSEIIASAIYSSDIQQRLEKSEKFAAQLLDRMGEGMAATDANSAITMINRKLSEMAGLEDGKQAIGWQASEIFPEYFESLAVGYGNFIAGQNDGVSHTTLRRRTDDHLVPILLSGTPRLERNELVGSYLIARDISGLNVVEHELKKAKQSIEHVELFRRQFLAVASHELRTPLNAILGLTQILLGMGLGDEATPLLETVHESAENMSRLVSDILDYSRLEAGKLSLSPAPFNLRELLAHIERSFSLVSKERNSKLSVVLDNNTPVQLVGDESRLRQVLTNLLTNAFKFTSNGQVSVRVSLEKPAPDLPENTNLLKFVVQDTGVGMSDYARQNIFQPFFTESGRIGVGTGLGLSISRHIAELMGGKIWLDDTSERGSRFIFTAQFKKREE